MHSAVSQCVLACSLEPMPHSPVCLAIEGWAIFVRGLHEEMTEDDLHDRFADFGTIKDLRMPLDHRTGYVKGYAIIEFSAYQEARNAIDKMHQETLMDSIISCSFAFVRGPKRNSEDKRSAPHAPLCFIIPQHAHDTLIPCTDYELTLFAAIMCRYHARR